MDMPEVKEFFLDILHMTGMALSSGGKMPSTAILDRESYYRICEAYEKQRVRQMVKELERQNFLQIKEKGNQIIINLTQKGKLEALKREILHNPTKLPRGMICLVTFDIPENVKKSRQVLRRFLKQAGFKQVHLSVWQSDNDVVDALQDLIDRLDIKKWVKVYTAFDKTG